MNTKEPIEKIQSLRQYLVDLDVKELVNPDWLPALDALVTRLREAEEENERDWLPIDETAKEAGEILLSDGWNTHLGSWDDDDTEEGGQCWRDVHGERIEYPGPVRWRKVPRYYASTREKPADKHPDSGVECRDSIP